jgi:inner membrane protein import complex subunit Tim44-like protein
MKKLLVVALLLVAPVAHARPGGGNRWSGGSDDYSPPPSSPPPSRSWDSSDDDDHKSSWSWGGSSTPPPPPPSRDYTRPREGSYEPSPSAPLPADYDSTPAIVRLVTSPPVAATLLGSIALVVLLYFRRKRLEQQQWDLTMADYGFEPSAPDGQPPTQQTIPIPRVIAEARQELEALRAEDPELSVVLFDDFLYALYTAFHEARGGHRVSELAPYLGPEAQKHLESQRVSDVKNVIVGAMRLVRARREERQGAPWILLHVQFEANLTEVRGDGREQGLYLFDEWVLARKRAARTRAPEALKIHECPNCGGALADLKGNTCAYCNTVLTPGAFDWAVERISSERESRAPVLTGADPVEKGTDLPTVVHPEAKSRFQAFCTRDQSFSWPGFQGRVGVVFQALHQGWAERDWKIARPYVSDLLFQSQLYWIEEYRRQHLVNKTDAARIVEIQMSNVTSDKHYDAITVRVFATGFDHTTREDGALVSGSRTTAREYSEYWTFMRSREPTAPKADAAQCPNCGAALAISMAGSCEHCSVKVTSGRFDWVLSRIEQDEAYAG